MPGTEIRLAPRPPNRQQLEQQARSALAREALITERTTLIAELRRQFEVTTDSLPWRVGSWQITATDLDQWPNPGVSGEQIETLVVEQLLLAEEGKRRGFLTPELEAQVDTQLRQGAIQAEYQAKRTAYTATLPEDRLRPIYDARPAAFATLEMAHLDLIFVPQGRDVFATQQRMEGHVEKLRAGASFAELARRISEGPEAEQGGDLGLLPPSEWVRLGPEVYKAVTATEPGGVSAPVYLTDRILTSDPRTLRGGFALVHVRAKIPPQERSFEQVIDDLRTVYARRNIDEINREVRDEILASSGFEIVRYPTLDELAQ